MKSGFGLLSQKYLEKTNFEDGKYKMLRSQIKEVVDPDYSWFYE